MSHTVPRPWSLFVMFVAAVALLLPSPRALADGKVFNAQAVATPTQIPDQRAIIVCHEDAETLVIDTSFVGEGTDFAWVVPLPAKPDVQPVAAGVFDCLQAAFAPKVKRLSTFLPIAVAAWLLIAAALAHCRPLLRDTVLVLITGLFLLVLDISLGTLRGFSSAPTAAVQVLDRRQVGSFEVTTLGADDAKALSEWLTSNGFAVSTKAQGAIDSYIADGWVFVASKLKRDASSDKPVRPHPLAFTFPTQKHVYPMRLTGVEADRPLDLELYVFGANEAHMPGLRCERSDSVRTPSPGEESLNRYGHGYAHRPPATGAIYVQHQSLESMLGGTDWGTRLVGTLSVPELQNDMYVQWGNRKARGEVVYARQDVAWRALAAVAAVLALWIISLKIMRAVSARARTRAAIGFGLAAFTGAAAIFVAYPSVDAVQSARSREYRMFDRVWTDALSEVPNAMWCTSDHDDHMVALTDPAQVTETIEQFIAAFDRQRRKQFEEYPDSTQSTVGDGPGQYRLEKTDQGVTLHYYDAWGREWLASMRPGTPRK